MQYGGWEVRKALLFHQGGVNVTPVWYFPERTAVTDQIPASQAVVSPGQAPHFAALDSIRGIAALSVVLFHIGWRDIVGDLSYARNSYLMVDLFFVLSGFVIFYAYGARLKSIPDVSRFMWLRFWRLESHRASCPRMSGYQAKLS